MLHALLAVLALAFPFALDDPWSEALVVRIVASEVAVLDQATAGVTAAEVDDLELDTMSELSCGVSIVA